MTHVDEWTCVHGIGHPLKGVQHHGGGIHGCCQTGCCQTLCSEPIVHDKTRTLVCLKPKGHGGFHSHLTLQ